ncbi:MAG: hypothetical protein KBE09_04865 [Candidatus Pacebacteria bacterium]|nr:hypothetical protein [Candidatus Paceibacterota bacterium]
MQTLVIDAKFVLAFVAFLLSAAAYVPYVLGILHHSARPTMSSWIAWGLMDVVLLWTAIAAKSLMAFQMAAYTFGVLIVLLACISRRAYMGWTTLDTKCVGIVVLSVIAWLMTGSASLVIVLCLIAAVVGTWPLIVNLREDPTREPVTPWILVALGSVFGIMAIREFTIVNAATPIVFLLLQVYILKLIFPHRIREALRDQ